MTTNIDESLEELRAVRVTISTKFNHDIRRLASYYQEMEKQMVDNNALDDKRSLNARLIIQPSPLLQA